MSKTDLTDPYYVLGRLAGVASLVQEDHNDGKLSAAEQIVEFGELIPWLLRELRHELLADTRRTRSYSAYLGEAHRLEEACWYLVAPLPTTGAMSKQNYALVQKGYHHQRAALLAGMAGWWQPPVRVTEEESEPEVEAGVAG